MDSFRTFAAVALLLFSAASRAAVFTVNNPSDHGPGTLRNALASAAAHSGADIINIAPRFNGGRLILDSQLTVSGDPDVTIDASALDEGFTIATDLEAASASDPPGAGTRILEVQSGSGLTLRGLTLADGRGLGFGEPGAAISNAGRVTLERCRLMNHDSRYSAGGAIANAGTLAATLCTFSGNQGSGGGAISNTGTLTLSQCTFTNNFTVMYGIGLFGPPGGAILSSSGTMQVKDCLFLGNRTSSSGGAISVGTSESEVRIERSTFTDNQGTFGGAVSNGGSAEASPLVISRCTFSGNTAVHGGALHNGGILALTRCTFSGNNAQRSTVFNNWKLTLTHCTLAGNNGGDSGAIINSSTGTVTLAYNIIAGNTAGSDTDNDANITNLGTVSRTGPNLIESFSNEVDGTDSGPAALTGNPWLAPLAGYGGPVRTMALYLDSPARDAAAGSTDTVDQRGFPVAGVPDLGAYEAGPFVAGNPATALAEALPGNAPPGSTLPDGDFDGDGASNVQEIAAGTSLTNPASIFRITAVEKASGLFVLSFPTVSGRIYTLQQSASLAPGSWSSAGGASLTGDGSVKSFTVPVGGARKFHRVQASTP